jgi:hypothetical protein
MLPPATTGSLPAFTGTLPTSSRQLRSGLTSFLRDTSLLLILILITGIEYRLCFMEIKRRLAKAGEESFSGFPFLVHEAELNTSLTVKNQGKLTRSSLRFSQSVIGGLSGHRFV